MPTRDFTKKREPVAFTIGAHTYNAYPAIAADPLADLGARLSGNLGNFETLGTDKQLAVLKEFLKEVLEPDSYELLNRQCSNRNDPVEAPQLLDVSLWLMEVYGMRPTEPPSSSSDGSPSPEPGTASTESAPAGDSIPETFQPTGS